MRSAANSLMHWFLLVVALALTPSLRAQADVALHGKTVDSTGTGISALITVHVAPDDSEIARGVSAADGSFLISLPRLPSRITVDASTRSGLIGSVQVDSLAVLGSGGEPILIQLRELQRLAPVQVRARYQRRPSVFSFFDTDPSSRVEATGATAVEWLDPLAVGGMDALLRASPELLITNEGQSSLLGAPSASNQLQVGGVRVPGELVSGQLGGTIATSPWDATIGGAAGATVDLFRGPAANYRSAYLTFRSGVGGVPGWIGSVGDAPGVAVPVQIGVGATGPAGRFGYRANMFVSRDATILPRWDRALSGLQREILDSVSTVLGTPTVQLSSVDVRAGFIGRLDILPFNTKKVLALTSALTRATRDGGTRGAFLTGSLGTEFIEDVGLLQLESTRVLRERVLWSSSVSGSVARSDVRRATAAPTIVLTDPATGNVFVTGGASPQSGGDIVAGQAHSKATWYSTNNKVRYVAQLQTRTEHARQAVRDAHGTFTSISFDALRNAEAILLSRDAGSSATTASSIVFAPSTSARLDLGRSGSLTLGIRADAWTVEHVAASGSLRYVDISPRVALLRRIGARSADRGPVATVRVGAGRFTDWPDVRQWSDAWRGTGAERELCSGDNVPTIQLANAAPDCGGSGTVQRIGRTIAGGDLRPTAANRADVSVAIAEVMPGVRAELGAALAQNSRMGARLSPLARVAVTDRLAGERDRALLVPAASIGADGVVPVAPISNAEPARLVPEGRSTAQQWRVRVASRDPFARTKVDAVYTLTTGRERSLSVASPATAPGFVSGPLAAGGRHTFALSVGTWIGAAEVRLAGMARSGLRFTPLADRDLNGDGRVNDAAYVPADVAETWVSAAPRGMRSCVRAAAGRIAAVNSCTGPWSVSSLLLASIPGVPFGMRHGAVIEVQLSNPLGLLARGSGQSRVVFGDVAAVTPTLARVTGFDVAAGRFLSEPLRGFGRTAGLSPRISAPVRLAVSARLPLGPSVTSQRTEVALRAMRRDTSAEAQQGAALEFLGDIPPLPIIVLQASDAIGITADQREALQALTGRWMGSAAGIVLGAVRGEERPNDGRTPRERVVQARSLFLDDVSAIAAEIRQLLSADQVDLLPETTQRLLNPRFLRFLSLQDAGGF
jgi:hypothetical protein